MRSLVHSSRGLSHWKGASLVALALISPAMLTGCGEAPEVKVPVVPVTGTISVYGEKPTGARVTLHPQGHPIPEGRAAVGTVKADGSYSVSLYDEPQGIPAGEYVATVEWFKPIDGGGGPDVIVKPYNSADASPIKVSVKDSPVTVPPIEIKK